MDGTGPWLALPGHSKQLEVGTGPSNQLDSQGKPFRGKTEGKAHGGEQELHRSPFRADDAGPGLVPGWNFWRTLCTN